MMNDVEQACHAWLYKHGDIYYSKHYASSRVDVRATDPINGEDVFLKTIPAPTWRQVILEYLEKGET